jgi:hypothetical protein
MILLPRETLHCLSDHDVSSITLTLDSVELGPTVFCIGYVSLLILGALSLHLLKHYPQRPALKMPAVSPPV